MTGKYDGYSEEKGRAAQEVVAQSYLNGARKIDPDTCPKGWDADVWALALRFRELARKDRIVLAVGMPLIYAKLEQRIDASGIKGGVFRDGKCRLRTWQDHVRAMMVTFWDSWQDEYALDSFCDPVVFRSVSRKVRDHARNLRQIARQEQQMRDNPRERRIMTRGEPD